MFSGVAAGGAATLCAVEPMAKSNPFEFLQQVRAEAAKVTWPTRSETLVTTGMVLLMIIVASLFFLLTDTVIRWVIALILGVGR